MLGVDFAVRAADIDERPLLGEDPREYVLRLAGAKVGAVAAREEPHSVVVGADTTVSLDGSILGKPTGRSDAARMLGQLSGRTHLVHTGVALTRGGMATPVVSVVSTEVDMAELEPAEIDWYLDTGEPFDKAGAYALQGAGGIFVRAIRGSASNVVGLPLRELVELARSVGLTLWPAPAGRAPADRWGALG
jgi:septum formation protein